MADVLAIILLINLHDLFGKARVSHHVYNQADSNGTVWGIVSENGAVPLLYDWCIQTPLGAHSIDSPLLTLLDNMLSSIIVDYGGVDSEGWERMFECANRTTPARPIFAHCSTQPMEH